MIDTKVSEYYYGFDEGLFFGDVTMLEILDPYTKIFNAIDKGSGLESSGAIADCVQRNNSKALVYLFEKDLIRSKAFLSKNKSYQSYLDWLLYIANDPNRDQCGRILLKNGANPYIYFQKSASSCVILKYPEYLNECYKKEGINAFIKFKELFMKEFVFGDTMDKIKIFLSDFEKRKDLPSEDLEYIKEFNSYLKKDYSMLTPLKRDKVKPVGDQE